MADLQEKASSKDERREIGVKICPRKGLRTFDKQAGWTIIN